LAAKKEDGFFCEQGKMLPRSLNKFAFTLVPQLRLRAVLRARWADHKKRMTGWRVDRSICREPTRKRNGSTTVPGVTWSFLEFSLIFDYKLRSGISTERNAIRVLERMGLPKTIVDQALAQVAQHHNNQP
jgi:hypothetical protein